MMQPGVVPLSLIVGTSDQVDFIADSIADPDSVMDSDCEHGFESASFTIPEQDPHVKAHHLVTEGTPVKVVRTGKTTFEGTIVSVDDTGVEHEVECAGLYDQMSRREDYAMGVIEGRYDLFQPLSPDLTASSVSKLSDNFSIDTDGQLLINLPGGTEYKTGQFAQVYLPVIPEFPGEFAIERATFTLTTSFGVGQKLTWGFSNTAESIDIAADLDVAITSTVDLSLDIDVALLCGPDLSVFWVRYEATADATTSADRYAQIRDLKLYINRTVAPRPDEIIEEIAVTNGPCTASETEELGTAVGQFMVDPFTTRTDAIEQARALYSSVIDVGVWDDATVHVRSRPLEPDHPQRHYFITSANLDNPDDWGIARDAESTPEAICCAYEYVPVNELAQVAQVEFTDTSWPTTWSRSTSTNVEVYNDTGYKIRVKTSATERNPWAASDYMPVIEGQSYLARCRARVASYPGSGTVDLELAHYDASFAFLGNAAIKSFSAASTTEAWYELPLLMYTPAATVAYVRFGISWRGVTTGGASVYSIFARDFSIQPVTTEGTRKTIYYPSKPSSNAARTAMLELGSATTADALAAATQVYTYASQQAVGSCALHGTVETIDGARVPVEHIRSWDWVTKADAADAADRGPFMLSRVERTADGTSIEIGGDYWQHPGFDYTKGKGRYVGGRWKRRRYKQWKRSKKKPSGKGWKRRGGRWWRWRSKRVWVEGRYK